MIVRAYILHIYAPMMNNPGVEAAKRALLPYYSSPPLGSVVHKQLPDWQFVHTENDVILPEKPSDHSTFPWKTSNEAISAHSFGYHWGYAGVHAHMMCMQVVFPNGIGSIIYNDMRSENHQKPINVLLVILNPCKDHLFQHVYFIICKREL